MNTLSVSQIFSNFEYYQTQYLSILENHDLYFIQVQGAYLQLSFLGHQKLYLGDLLQLWFSEKWVFNTERKIQFFSKQILKPSTNFYLFVIDGSMVTGRNFCRAWSVSAQEVVDIQLDALLPYYCYAKCITQPKACEALLDNVLS